MTKAAILEQLAEEASELCHAALKLSRILRGENPTPVTLEEAEQNLREEYTDLVVVADSLSIGFDVNTATEKRKRWEQRLSEKEDDQYVFFEL
jgi:NTP pyrophosphatase (non-canonical NTP hydrolase)